MLRRIVPAAVVVTLALALASCGTPAKPSGVYGIVLLSGGPAIVSPSPLPYGFGSGAQGRILDVDGAHVWTVKGGKLGKLVARATFGPDSTFRLMLAPGAYILQAVVSKDGGFAKPSFVTVKPGRYSRVIVYVEGR
jgi:hypothetical protein